MLGVSQDQHTEKAFAEVLTDLGWGVSPERMKRRGQELADAERRIDREARAALKARLSSAA